MIMKHFTYILLSVILVFTSCGNKKLDDKSVCGVYPHLLKAEKEFVNELDKLTQSHDIESEKEKVKVKEEKFYSIYINCYINNICFCFIN